VRKFCVESQDTENQKHEENIRLHDSRKKSLPRGKLESCARSTLQRECHLRPVEARNRSPVNCRNRSLVEFTIKSIIFASRASFSVKALDSVIAFSASSGLPFAPLRKTSQKRHGILIDFLSKYFIDLLRKAADRDDR